jgi:uncharacterized damage-inducible protein DinB
MPHPPIPRPAATEYPVYFGRYVATVPDEGDILDLLRTQVRETSALVAALNEEQAEFRYAEGKWSIKEMVGHLTDTERVMVYRAVCIARGETQSLPGFDENQYVAHAKFQTRAVPDLLEELRVVREASIRFFATLDEEEVARKGLANGKEVTAGALAYIVAGHERHHQSVLRERYLPHLRPPQ